MVLSLPLKDVCLYSNRQGYFLGCLSDLMNSHCKTETLKVKVTLLFVREERNAGSKYE